VSEKGRKNNSFGRGAWLVSSSRELFIDLFLDFCWYRPQGIKEFCIVELMFKARKGTHIVKM